MIYTSYNFTHAITRKPSQSVIYGLASQKRGIPDVSLMECHHKDYVRALKKAGANVVELEALELFPDSLYLHELQHRGYFVGSRGRFSRLVKAHTLRVGNGLLKWSALYFFWRFWWALVSPQDE